MELVTPTTPAGIDVSAFCFPEKTTCALMLLVASVELHVTKALPAAFAAMEAFQPSEVEEPALGDCVAGSIEAIKLRRGRTIRADGMNLPEIVAILSAGIHESAV